MDSEPSYQRFGGPMARAGGQGLIALAVAAFALGASFLVGLNPGIAAILTAVVLVSAWLLQILRRRQRGQAASTVGVFAAHVAVAGVATMLLIQLVPYGREHSNPPVTAEPQWANPETRDMMVRGCFGCHSNQVEWPWYSNIAPMSWAITDHVNEGRDAVNYSEFDQPQEEADETIEVIQDGSMPPAYYTRFGLHADANLTTREIAVLVAGLEATPGLAEGSEEEEEEEEED